MNEQEQRIAIATQIGWDCDPVEAHEWGSRGQWVVPPDSVQLNWPYTLDSDSRRLVSGNTFLPDYLNDLNAMHEAENVATSTHLLEAKYEGFLMEAVCEGPQRSTDNIFLIRSTASQRAEAFLKTLNLWTV